MFDAAQTTHSPLVQRLLARTTEDGDCLIWQGACCNGHPAHRHNGPTVMVRRTLFTELLGPLKGRMVRMTCSTPLCVNPEHIQAVTRQQIAADLGKQGVMGGLVRSASIQRTKRLIGITRLTPMDVHRIRTSNETGVALAAALGVSQAHVSKVRLHKAHRDYSSPFAGLGARP